MPDDSNAIPFARPFIGREEEEAVLRVLRSGWLTTGTETLNFEKEFAAFLQAGGPGGEGGQNPGPEKPVSLYALAVNSATSGLHLALEACGVKAGDLVLVPSFTFASTAEVACCLGAEPVFVDVSPGGFNMDPQALEQTLDRLFRGLPAYPPRRGQAAGSQGFGPRGRPAALIPVHYGGLPCDMAAILDIARRRGVKVIEDAAHAFPSLLEEGAFAGTLGDAGVFSFYATKTLTTGEGGMVVCGDKKIAGRISILRSHGIDRSVWNRYTDAGASWYYEVVEAGYKYNLPDILGALGRVQLSRAWDLLQKRKDIAARYDTAFGKDQAFIIPPDGPGNARHLYPLRLNPRHSPLPRDQFIQKLQAGGIGVSVHFIPLHTMPYYKKRYGFRDGDFPESLAAFQQIISLPLWPGMNGSQINRVIRVVKNLRDDYTQ
ncbi:MAG: DegT/DnrJ/EryC1/StrS aminotransferase family protein [Treponema sp.]|jgi:dTDP-4-amino-4,6-dideoxygalactose transaminase|nr:DegT/DnrJ/EryC1/StrS aminotransferase family protein [Treponema sp.]